MWVGVWRLRRQGEDKFAEFCSRYNQFLKEDWVRLCDKHHAEIHLVYDGIIKRDKLKTGRPLSKYSWAQAEKLMEKLEAACVKWIKKDTPGVEPEFLNNLRDKRRQIRHD